MLDANSILRHILLPPSTFHSTPILRILEPCKHPVQLGGLCAVCGKDLTGSVLCSALGNLACIAR